MTDSTTHREGGKASHPITHLADEPALDSALRASWGLDTCDPADVVLWSTANPARGQCGVTALVLQDYLGGELLRAEVTHADGTRQGLHYWNRLRTGVEVDLTRDQFDAGELIGPGQVQPRPPGLTPPRLAGQYASLQRNVRDLRRNAAGA